MTWLGSSAPLVHALPGRDRDALEIEPHQDRLGVDTRKRDVASCSASRGAPPPLIRTSSIVRLDAALRAGRAARRRVLARAGVVPRDALERRRQPHDARDVFRARAASELLPSAVDQRGKRAGPRARRARRRPWGRRTCAPRAPADRRRASRGRNVEPARRLHGVGVEEHSALARDRREVARSAGRRRSRCWRTSR